MNCKVDAILKTIVLLTCLTITLSTCALQVDEQIASKSQIAKNVKAVEIQSAENLILSGTISQVEKPRLLIYMTLKRNGSDLTGEYFYLKDQRQVLLKLSGKIYKNNNFILVERDQTGKKTGEFRGKWSEENERISLDGKWVSLTGKKKLYFSAKQQIIAFKSSAKLIPKRILIEVPKAFISIDAVYPELSGVEGADIFNQKIRGLIDEKISDFRKDLSDFRKYRNKKDIESMKKVKFPDSLWIDYDVTFADENIISVNFTISTSFYGMAHPNHSSFTYNFDFRKKAPLALHEIFTENADYLSRLSKLCEEKVKRKRLRRLSEIDKTSINLSEGELENIKTGTAPDLENYSAWALTEKGILIIFPPYQVGPYAEGFFEILVTYDEIKDILRKDGPVKVFLR
jgi:hypothetical protein